MLSIRRRTACAIRIRHPLGRTCVGGNGAYRIVHSAGIARRILDRGVWGKTARAGGISARRSASVRPAQNRRPQATRDSGKPGSIDLCSRCSSRYRYRPVDVAALSGGFSKDETGTRFARSNSARASIGIHVKTRVGESLCIPTKRTQTCSLHPSCAHGPPGMPDADMLAVCVVKETLSQQRR